MNKVLKKIADLITETAGKPNFLDLLFGQHKKLALQAFPIVLFGAGELGKELYNTLKFNNISPVCFCDNKSSEEEHLYCDIPVISFSKLKQNHKNSLIIIATQKHALSITNQLRENGFSNDLIKCKGDDPKSAILFMYSTVGTQNLFNAYELETKPLSLFATLLENEQEIEHAYNLFADQKSKELYVAKLALMSSQRSLALFENFMLKFSEPIVEFGPFNYNGTPEDYFYFNNDVLSPSQNEVYIDIGAYDGDTVGTFIQACKKYNINYKKIFAFEPDPQCYKSLLKNTLSINNISCHNLGLWSRSTTLQFTSSLEAIHDQAGAINNDGDINIKVVSLDDFLKKSRVSFIKMDPGGNIIPEVIKGSANTISTWKPKLALGAYHSIKSIFEIPLLVKNICPNYNLFLRHNTYHLCDTALYATIQ